jgi:hypothetical protein
MVLSTALFDKPAFKNLVCNGLVLASDGKKMSKRLKNYPVSGDQRHILYYPVPGGDVCCAHSPLLIQQLRCSPDFGSEPCEACCVILGQCQAGVHIQCDRFLDVYCFANTLHAIHSCTSVRGLHVMDHRPEACNSLGRAPMHLDSIALLVPRGFPGASTCMPHTSHTRDHSTVWGGTCCHTCVTSVTCYPHAVSKSRNISLQSMLMIYSLSTLLACVHRHPYTLPCCHWYSVHSIGC